MTYHATTGLMCFSEALEPLVVDTAKRMAASLSARVSMMRRMEDDTVLVQLAVNGQPVELG